jgi:flagellar hook-associated protein FlgK
VPAGDLIDQRDRALTKVGREANISIDQSAGLSG